MIVSQSDWGVVKVSGADRVRFMQGMCMGNVETIAPGGWLRTATLDAKGRLRTAYDLVARDDDFLLVCFPGLAESTCEILGRYAIADDVSFEVVDMPVFRDWPDPAAVWSAPPLFAAPDGSPADADAVEVRRVEAGLPLFGREISDKTFPFETPLAALIDYKKGCYVGQEPVARVYSKGEPSRRLRGFVLDGDSPVEVGTAIDRPDRAGAGKVSSSVISPQFGAIALGYLARGFWDLGGPVSIAGRSAKVVDLPMR